MFPLKLDTPDSALRSEIRSIRKSGIRTAFVVLLLISGFTPALCLLFARGSDASLVEQLQPVWSVFVHTYPLTIAIAVITFSRKRKMLRWGRWFFALAVIALGATIGNLFGEFTGSGIVEASNTFGDYRNPLFSIPAAGANYFIGFYEHYGARTFFAAIIIGSFAGSVANRMVGFVPKDVNGAATLVAEIAESRRRAA